MALLYAFLPVLLFFIAYHLWGIYVATSVLIAATLIQTGYEYFKNKRLTGVQILTAVLIVLFGAATLVLRDPKLLQWKVTVVNWLLAAFLAGTQWLTPQSFMERLLTKETHLPKKICNQLNMLWTIFFAVIGALNLIVAYYASLNTWVNFKLFGILGLTLVCLLAQGLYLYRYLNKRPSS